MALILLAQNIRRRRRNNIPPVIRDRRNPLDFTDDDGLLRKYSMDRNSIFEICDVLERDLARPARRSGALPVSLQVIVELRYYATGSFQSVLADGHGISTMSVSRCVRDVSFCISQRMQDHIKYPFTERGQRIIKQGFYEIAEFPQVLGAVDGTFIPIKAPHDDEHLYVTRKGFHEINVQGICDASNVFLNLVVRWPGSTHDAFVLSNSQISDCFESGRIQDCWLLGDSAYPLRPWLLTPLPEPRNVAERRYNTAHKRTRSVIERTYGIWKMRFRCLHKSGGYLTLLPGRCVRVIMATAILHNICTRNHVPLPDNVDWEIEHDDDAISDGDSDEDGDDEYPGNQFDGRHLRENVIN